MRHCSLTLLVLASVALAGEPIPTPEVRLTANGAVMQNGAKISGRPGEKLELKAQVFGGRRAWCMEPKRFANLGQNTRIETSGADGLSFSTGPGFKGVWKLKSEIASWWGQLADDISAAPHSNKATIKVPSKPGSYALQVKVVATWHYDRKSDGNHVEELEKNEAEGNYTLVVDDHNAWFTSENIFAEGNPDDDLRFRLQALQKNFDLISEQALEGKFDLAGKNLDALKETLTTVRERIEKLKKKNPDYQCSITFIGTPLDKGMKKVAALKAMAEQWKKMHSLVTANAQKINTLLLKTQMVFSNNILKSVVKNYLDWGSGIPGVGDFFGSVPVNLQALLIPSNIMEWYGNAEADASLLKNQALSIKHMSELRDFYLQRAAGFVEESRKIHADMDLNKPVEALDTRARTMLSATGFAKWRASAG